jgi:hypothetical protein
MQRTFAILRVAVRGRDNNCWLHSLIGEREYWAGSRDGEDVGEP